ncbi:hypothetical protein [Acinetobacter dispersus]|uniref:hypothetical protein n=1 Tax=Acinetobacter dispersus TaxID=70348 RepID=UPI001F4A9EA0|nr:hypothetical protein [Acinetobacter dispersus]MCH7389607.1 hypothetical protein [Acinetobacter dispersus]
MDNLSNIWGFIKEFSGVFASIPALIYLTNLIILKYIKKDELVLQKDLNIQLELEKSNFNIEIERIRSQLNQENEKLKSELQQKNIMLEIAYSGIYKNRLDSLQGIYKNLLMFENALRENNKTLGEKSETVEKCKTIFKQFKNEYYENAIFLPNILDQRLENLLIKLQNSIYNQSERKQISRSESMGNHELANIILNKLMEQENEITTIRYELCDSIRDIIGTNYINNDKKAP